MIIEAAVGTPQIISASLTALVKFRMSFFIVSNNARITFIEFMNGVISALLTYPNCCDSSTPKNFTNTLVLLTNWTLDNTSGPRWVTLHFGHYNVIDAYSDPIVIRI